jgi:uncharacterized protein YbjT (DUF2867 family)
MSNTSNKSLFLVGGTGGLGTEVAKGLVTAEGFDHKVALVRTSAAEDKVSLLEEFGWTIRKIDFEDENEVLEALHGAKVLVSTLSGPKLMEMETKLIDAAKRVGVSLFVPSQFGVDYRRWKGDFPVFEAKRKVLSYASEVNLPTLSVFVGAFSDVIFYFLADMVNMQATIVSGGKSMFSFTKRSDIGHVLAKALNDPKYELGGYLSIQSDTLPWVEALGLVEKATGKTFEKTNIDPEEALGQEKSLLEKGDLGSFYQAFGLHLLGEPSRGSSGFDVSAESVSYNFPLETLETTVTNMFASKK